MIYDRQDGVKVFAFGHLGDQIHGYDLKWSCFRWNVYAVEGNFISMRKNFILLAGSAAFDILGDPFTHAWPPIPFRNVFIRLVSAWVSGRYRVMIDSQNLSFDRVFRRTADAVDLL